MAGKQFWIQTCEGLCNRFRVLLSAIGFCEMTNRELVICWPLSKGGKLRPLVTGESHKRFQAGLSDLWVHPYREVGRKEWKKMCRKPSSVEASVPPDPGSDAPILYLNTYEHFFHNLPHTPRQYASRLELIPELHDRVERFSGAYFTGTPQIGIHIRHHKAHEFTTTHSPVSWFVGRMGELQALYPQAGFFLSTDSSDLSERFSKRFPGLMREQCTPPGFNTREGIQKGLVDLYLLARTDYILGSYFSSFSEMALWLQGEKGYEDAQRRVGSLP